MKAILTTAAILTLSGAAAFAESHAVMVDAEAGEGDFRKCKSCHAISSADEDIVKGGRTGPNLYGVIGRTAGSYEDFNYGDDIVAAGEAGLVWDTTNMVEYLADPKAFLQAYLEDDGAKSKMTFKLKDGEDVAAYLATFSEGEMEEGEGS
ncbi:cytochrome c [Maritimibacter alkaliphilus HTCC2654]|uniref:Cytochrome c family protein n=1 Tax=Maritimibacter alkaliphilus HTCC2654 TaxID=314271 RepID=A3VHI3_9RHOB|nr:cytochrome c550 [Maritimibacter alkaliphilus]EAQ12174.1 cytochrome c family protein [Rhodobacterales bacterium HTCC2654] [Maritimibacter alkaliphilus HTCC2654]TYP85532.1 cytochrome c [Maritimibacter alkaliphilus HTCC2654]